MALCVTSIKPDAILMENY